MPRDLPHFKPGSSWNEQSARDFNLLVEEVRRLKGLISSSGLNIPSGAKPRSFNAGEIVVPRDKTVVIVEKPVAGDAMLTVREAKYADLPPQPCVTAGTPPVTTCHYAWHGEPFAVWPPMGKEAVDYAGDELVDAPEPKLDTVFHRCHRVHNSWVLTPTGKSAITIQQFRIVGFSGYPDVITGKTWDGTTLGDKIVFIAKPFTLRRSRFEGFIWNDIIYSFQSNIERTAIKTIPGDPPTEIQEKQVIVPTYTVDQTIYAAKGIMGGLATSYDDEDDLESHDAEWLDLNVDGRQWAKKA